MVWETTIGRQSAIFAGVSERDCVGQHTSEEASRGGRLGGSTPRLVTPPASAPAYPKCWMRAKDGEPGLPPIVPLALATLVSAPPQGSGWVHEFKLDGYRLLARVHFDQVQLVTRPGNDWTSNAPGVVDALRSLAVSTALLDGEGILLHENGTSDFHGLRSVRSKGRAQAVVFVAFDLLFLHGRDLRSAPLLERRLELARLLEPARTTRHIQVSQLFEGGGALYQTALKLGLEGTVSKRATGAYRAGRAGDWQKAKNPMYVRR